MSKTSKLHAPAWLLITGRYLWNIVVWIDQGFNVLLAPVLNLIFDGKFGDPDETLSSVFAKCAKHCQRCKRVCRLLHLLDPGHCDKSIEHDEGANALGVRDD